MKLRLEKQRTKDIKLFLRKEQALLRIEQAEKQKQFLKQLKLEKQIEKFRIREVKELERLEKISLKKKEKIMLAYKKELINLKKNIELLEIKKLKKE